MATAIKPTTDDLTLASELVRDAGRLCGEARAHVHDGNLAAARVCYIRAEGKLMRADRLRGVDVGPVILDARADVERRMGLVN